MLDPLLREWFAARFPTLTEPQAFAVPLIQQRENVLVSSPTGSGKTLTAFLSVLNELLRLQREGGLQDKVYCVYVSPLRALANDINRNLTLPLEEMTAQAQARGEEPPRIRLGVRTGDTSTRDRQRMARKPPHILITTPESLSIVLSTPKFAGHLAGVEWFIVDEIHELCGNKRGVHLSLSLERLRERTQAEFVRIGLSATIAPVEEVARFLVGFVGGKLRPVHIVEVDSRKALDLGVLCPVPDLNEAPYEIAHARMIDQLADLIQNHRTTLVFTNTRAGAESLSYKLKERGVTDLATHHGSLSKAQRLEVEEKLKRGELRAAITSTSLELGIDIGSIDLVCQIGSPKTIAKALQRIGRAGHAYGGTSRGRFLVFTNDDAAECAAVIQGAYTHRIDPVEIPRNSLDILAQTLVGMSLEKAWEFEAAFQVVRRSFCYRNLSRKDFRSVLDYLSGRNPDARIYAKLWYDEEEGRFGRKRGTRMIYYTNVGAIPEEGDYDVIDERGQPIGRLSDRFVEYLNPRDVFLLGGKTYQFERLSGRALFVRDASGRNPTVPTWAGEVMPRSKELSCQVAHFRGELSEKIRSEGPEAANRWLLEEFRLDPGTSKSLVSYVQEQRILIPAVPTDRALLLEGYLDERGMRHLIYHFCFGRRINETLAKAYGLRLSERLGCAVRTAVTDNCFMLSFPRNIEPKEAAFLVPSEDLERILRRAVWDTELFRTRFRHCATRSFLTLRRYKGREVSPGRQHQRSEKLLEFLRGYDSFPVIRETYSEVLHSALDLTGARQVLSQLEKGEIRLHWTGYSSLPSPFAHAVILLGLGDLMFMEDRAAFSRDLHREILRKVLSPEALQEATLNEDLVSTYFRKKIPRIEDPRGLQEFLARAPPLDPRPGRGLMAHSTHSENAILGWLREGDVLGELEQVWTPQGRRWVHRRDLPLLKAVYARRVKLGSNEKLLIAYLGVPRTLKEIARKLRGKPSEIQERLKTLEPAYLIGRTSSGPARWKRRRIGRVSVEKGREQLLLRHLAFEGPLSTLEIAFHLATSEEGLRPLLRRMAQEGLIASGHFLLGGGFQHILASDLRRLTQEDQGDGIEPEIVQSYRMSKLFRPLPSGEAYLQVYGTVENLLDLFNHVEKFQLAQWESLRASGRILEGRFLGGRVRYVLADDAPLYLSAHPQEPLSPAERKVLDLLESLGEADLSSLQERSALDREVVRAALDKLDRHVYVVRKFAGNEGWGKRNVYLPFPPPSQVPDAEATLLHRAVRALGPVNRFTLESFLGWLPSRLEAALGKSLSQSKIVKIRVLSKREEECFLDPGELPALQSHSDRPSEDRLRLLSLQDPWIQPSWGEVVSRYGEAGIHPVVVDGKVCGAVELWGMSGCLEIREVLLEDPKHLRPLLRSLDTVLAFYRQMGQSILRVTRALGGEILESDQLEVFLKSGYRELSGFIAKGDFLPVDFSRQQLLASVFWKQGIHPKRRSQDLLSLVRDHGGLRSEFAARLRSTDGKTLDLLWRRGEVWLGDGIPDYLAFCVPEDLSLYQRAKAVPVSTAMGKVLRILERNGPLPRSVLVRSSPLGEGSTLAALRDLQRGTYLARDGRNRFVVVPNSSLSREEARRVVLERALRTYGVFTAENLSAWTRREFRMEEIRSILLELEREGQLVKGFFARGDRSVHWMLSGTVDELASLEFRTSFVLTPYDNLALYLAPELQAQWGMGTCFTIFQGTEAIAAFRVQRRKGKFFLTRYQGRSQGYRVLREFSRQNGVQLDEQAPPADDWEVVEWYEKLYGKK